MNLQKQDARFIAHTYHRYPLVLVKGKGCYVQDEQKRSYLDFTSGIGVNLFGYHDDDWMQAVQAQLAQLSHSSNLYVNEPAVKAAEMLCQKSGAQRVFFTNSGAESNEGAIKAARKYAHDRYGSERSEIITLCDSFHGRTITTLSATAQAVFHQHYMPFTPGFVHVKANDPKDLLEHVNSHTAAIMIEVVQGESGVRPLTQEFASLIQQVCEQRDILLIVDEVQSGIARCGSLFAYEQYGLRPDLVSCAKALGGGLPLGAVLFFDKTKDVFQYGDHGTTFGGNPLACVGACSILRRCQSDLYASVKEKGAYLKAWLTQMPQVKSVTQMGLMIGVELDHLDARAVVEECIGRGILLLTAKQRLRLLPPLIITREEIAYGMHILHDVLAQASSKSTV